MAEEKDSLRAGAAALARRVLHAGKPVMRACTIVAQNYSAQAEILVRSFQKFNPECPFTILVIDETHARTEPNDNVEILSLADIGLDSGDAYRMPVIYDVTELSTAVKPWLLRHLLGAGQETVIYFDPDIEIFSPLDELAYLAQKHSIVLTPHVTEPIPRDQRRLNESDILGAGIYNLGFIALGQGSHEFLDWWSGRLRRECLIDPARMRFTDQRWVDFVPGLFQHYILRDPGYNVAYWNLHGRKVEREGESYSVNSRPLRFFHFSGYNPNFPHILSKHQGARPRILLSEHPGVRRLCQNYREKLKEAGFARKSREPYGFDSIAGSLKIDQRLRRLYREALSEFEEGEGDEPPSPFAPGGEQAFLSWLNEPMTPGPEAVTRFMLALHGEREDLRNAFLQPLGADAKAFYTWFMRDGCTQERVHPWLIPGEQVSRSIETAEPRDEPQTVTEVSSEPIVNVAGYFRAELGIGEAARLLVAGLQAAGVPYRTISNSETLNRQSHPFEGSSLKGRHADINIICVNADQTPAFATKMGQEFFRDRYTIGVWFWEIEDFPAAFRSAFDHVDEVWVATEFMRNALAPMSPKPVFKFHLPLVRPEGAAVTLAEAGIPRPFSFLFSFDFMSVLERKNPIGVIQAFKRAFKSGQGPRLLIKTINGDKKLLDLERVRLAAIGRPDITISDGYVTSAEKDEMMANCDCYVSLHRSEGYGLTMAEAMSLGKPVLATAYSGNMEFMTSENSYLCPFAYTEIGYGAEPYPPSSRWAQPDLDQAVTLMRQIYDQPDASRQRGARAADDIRTLHSPAVAGGAIKDRLEAIRARRARHGKAIPAEVIEQRLEALEALPRMANRIFEEERARFLETEGQVKSLLSHFEKQQMIANRQEAALREATETIAREVKSLGAMKEVLGESSQRVGEIAATQVDIRKGLERRLDAVEAIANLSQQTHQQSGALQEMLTKIAARVEELGGHMEAAPYMTDPDLLTRRTGGAGRTLGYANSDSHSAKEENAYLSFEGVFRGSESLIRDRQRVYLDLLRENVPVIDLGCGRGEMLDLLKENNVPAIGVDLDPGMVEHSRAKGHEVVQEDIVTYLERTPDNSIGAIFCAQVIEHVSYSSLRRILSLGRRKLKSGGSLILETVNPHSHRALKTFWVDLTHNKPIFPEVLIVLCREAGYAEAYVQFPCGKGDFQRDRLWEGEYAVIAKNSNAASQDLVTPRASS